MTDSRSSLLGKTVYASIGQYADYAAGLIISIIIARSLGPERYGSYALLIWFATAGVALSNHGLTTGVMKFLAEARGQRDPSRARATLRYLERLQLWSALMVCGAIGAFIVFLAERVVLNAQARALLWVVLPAVVLRSLYVFWLSAAKGFEDFRLTAQVLAFAAPLGVALVLAVALAGASLTGFVYAYATVCLLYAAAMRYGLTRTLPGATLAGVGDVPVARIRRHVIYASAIVALELLVLRQAELLFLERFSTAENIAYYGIGQSLAMSAMLLVPGVATALLLPMMSRTFGEDPALLGGRFLAATRYILLLAVPVLALCEVFAPEVIAILYGPAFGPAVLVFRVAVVAAAVGVVSASASSYQLGSDRQPAVVGIMAAAAAMTLTLDWLLIRAWKLEGAIAAGAIGAVLLGIGLLWHAARALRVSFDASTYVRVVAAGALSAVPALIARAILPVWIALPVGAVLLTTVYLVMTVAMGAWTRPDIHFIRGMTGNRAGGAGAAIGAVLDWASARGTTRVPRDA